LHSFLYNKKHARKRDKETLDTTIDKMTNPEKANGGKRITTFLKDTRGIHDDGAAVQREEDKL
jgi:hypothetical protein